METAIDLLETRLIHQQKEEELLSGERDMFGIYQLRNDMEELRDYAFVSMNFLRKHGMEVKAGNYELVYAAPIPDNAPKDAAVLLEQIYERFNIDRPEDFVGHSLSMGDVVLLHRDGENTVYYTDRIGFAALPDFAAQRLRMKEWKQDISHMIAGNMSRKTNQNVKQSLEQCINHENRSAGGNGRNDNVTDYDELFRQDTPSVYEGENPQFFTEQIYAMMTGRTVDKTEITDRPVEKFSYERNFDYIVQTYHDNEEAYHDAARNIEIGTIYGSVALASVSQDSMGRFNLMDCQYTGRLKEDSAELEEGQLIVFTVAEILSVGMQREDGGWAYGNTALMNESFEEMAQLFQEPDRVPRTFRCYVENDRRAFDMTFFRHEGEKRFYIQDTGEHPLMMGEGTVSEDFEFTAYNAKEFLNEFGEDFSGKREFVVFDIHEPEVTQAQIEKAERIETLPVQLTVDMSLDSEAQTTKHFYFNDEQEAKRFAKTFQKEMQEFSDITGVDVAFESSIGERDDVKRDLLKRAENYEESPVVKVFREKTDELFHELAGNDAASIEQMVKSHVQGVLDDYGVDAVVVDAVLVGSRCRGIEDEDSDVDVVVEYYGDIAEDALFDLVNEDYLEVDGCKVDINPITEGKSGSLDTYLPQVESYLDEKMEEIKREQQAARQAEEQAARERAAKEAEEREKREAELARREHEEKKREAAANNSYSNFRLQKHVDDGKYDLIADVKGAGGEVRKDVAIAEFPDKEAALAFCGKNKVQTRDITNFLRNKISHKKHLMDEKGKENAGYSIIHSANQSM